ncbi:hypothetical protein OUZ56_023020 [Daphnia magna]|uniref:Uncharacterized protein n=1 Tax=Daphnia magna TaxID=35525 RepID=A0ABR0AYS8_9CRUS|nr:hypothetical protein OUZ56_023020 [Daphnia magna]
MELSRLTGVSWNGCTEMPLSTRSRVGGRGGNHVRFMRRDDLPSSNSYKEAMKRRKPMLSITYNVLPIH